MFYGENLKIGRSGVGWVDKEGRRLSWGEATGKIMKRIYNWGADLGLSAVNFVSEHCAIYTFRRLIFSLAGAKIGRGSKVHMGVRWFSPRGVTIGEDSVVGWGGFLDGRAKLKIGSHVSLASEVMVYNSEHDVNAVDFKVRVEPVEIGDYVFIGPRAIILPGVKVGKGAVVAAGAVVTEKVAARTIVGGVPAKVIGKRKLAKLNYRIGRTRLFS